MQIAIKLSYHHRFVSSLSQSFFISLKGVFIESAHLTAPVQPEFPKKYNEEKKITA